jgi:addiction module HigA family antidote
MNNFMANNLIPALHTGETPREDILEPLGMSVNQLARALGITATRLDDIVRTRRRRRRS